MTDLADENSPTSRRRPRRRHPALASRIAVTGMSTATMFGIVAALGVAGAAQDANQSGDTIPAPSPTLPAQSAATSTGATPGPTTTAPAPITTTVPATELSNEPIHLTANPVVRVVETPTARAAAAAPSAPAAAAAPAAAPAPQQQAPVASTNGSR